MAPFRAHQPDGVRSARRHPRFVRSKSLGGPDDPAARAGTSPGVRSPSDQRDHVQRGERRPRGPASRRESREEARRRARASRGRRRTRPRASPSAPAAGDWIELHNPGDGAVDVTGFTLIGSRSKKDDEEDAFEIPPGARPGPSRRVPRAGEAADAFAASRPELVLGVDVVNGSFGFNPSPKGELLTVLDRSGALVDAVSTTMRTAGRKPPTAAAPRSSSSTRGSIAPIPSPGRPASSWAVRPGDATTRGER